MSCGCQTTITPRKKADPVWMVLCTNCSGPLATLGGATVPVHVVEIPASPAQVQAWEDQGYLFEKRLVT